MIFGERDAKKAEEALDMEFFKKNIFLEKLVFFVYASRHMFKVYFNFLQ